MSLVGLILIAAACTVGLGLVALAAGASPLALILAAPFVASALIVAVAVLAAPRRPPPPPSRRLP